MAKLSLNIKTCGNYVVLVHDGRSVGLHWEEALDFYKRCKSLLTNNSFVSDKSELSATIISEDVIGVFLFGCLWFSCPKNVFSVILKEIYKQSKDIEQNTPSVAKSQINDVSVLLASSLPVFITKDTRKINEAINSLKTNQIPDKVVVSVPKLIGGDLVWTKKEL